jgi:hypothetical protein
VIYYYYQCFFLGESRGTLTPKHFVNLTGKSKKIKMLEMRVRLNIFLEKSTDDDDNNNNNNNNINPHHYHHHHQEHFLK